MAKLSGTASPMSAYGASSYAKSHTYGTMSQATNYQIASPAALSSFSRLNLLVVPVLINSLKRFLFVRFDNAHVFFKQPTG
jgi:hypothetical protein